MSVGVQGVHWCRCWPWPAAPRRRHLRWSEAPAGRLPIRRSLIRTELQRVELLDRLRDGMSHAPVVALFREGRLWFAGDPEDVELFLHLHGYSP